MNVYLVYAHICSKNGEANPFFKANRNERDFSIDLLLNLTRRHRCVLHLPPTTSFNRLVSPIYGRFEGGGCMRGDIL